MDFNTGNLLKLISTNSTAIKRILNINQNSNYFDVIYPASPNATIGTSASYFEFGYLTNILTQYIGDVGNQVQNIIAIDAEITFLKCSRLLPRSGLYKDIGDITDMFENIFSVHARFTDMIIDNITSSGTIYASYIDTLGTVTNLPFNCGIDLSGGILLNGNIIPQAQYWTLGSTTQYFERGYAGKFYAKRPFTGVISSDDPPFELEGYGSHTGVMYAGNKWSSATVPYQSMGIGLGTGGDQQFGLGTTGGTFYGWTQWRDGNGPVPMTNGASDLGTSIKRWGTVYCNTLNELSDMRYKNDIQQNTLGIDLIEKVNTYTYKRKNCKHNKKECGFVAQDMLQAINELGLSTDDVTLVTHHLVEPITDSFDRIIGQSEEHYSINILELIPIMWNSIKQLNQEIQQLKKKK